MRIGTNNSGVSTCDKAYIGFSCFMLFLFFAGLIFGIIRGAGAKKFMDEFTMFIVIILVIHGILTAISCC
jgi:hypothetical protein